MYYWRQRTLSTLSILRYHSNKQILVDNFKYWITRGVKRQEHSTFKLRCKKTGTFNIQIEVLSTVLTWKCSSGIANVLLKTESMLTLLIQEKSYWIHYIFTQQWYWQYQHIYHWNNNNEVSASFKYLFSFMLTVSTWEINKPNKLKWKVRMKLLCPFMSFMYTHVRGYCSGFILYSEEGISLFQRVKSKEITSQRNKSERLLNQSFKSN